MKKEVEGLYLITDLIRKRDMKLTIMGDWYARVDCGKLGSEYSLEERNDGDRLIKFRI